VLKVAYDLKLMDKLPLLTKMLMNMYKAFVERDCLELSINPLVITDDNKLTSMGATVQIDDSANFRQQELAAMIDMGQLTYTERVALLQDCHYIEMEGNIGVITNGAGCSMATNDLIELHGGKPANFLDLHGSSSAEEVIEMIHLINSNPKVDVMLLNIFSSSTFSDLISS